MPCATTGFETVSEGVEVRLHRYPDRDVHVVGRANWVVREGSVDHEVSRSGADEDPLTAQALGMFRESTQDRKRDEVVTRRKVEGTGHASPTPC